MSLGPALLDFQCTTIEIAIVSVMANAIHLEIDHKGANIRGRGASRTVNKLPQNIIDPYVIGPYRLINR